jgi:DNA-nicking Smr family endonuclease
MGKKPKGSRPSPSPHGARKGEGFSNPFYAQREKLTGVVAPPTVKVIPAPVKPEPKAVDAAQLFADEMAGVKRLAEDPRGTANIAPAPKPPRSRRAEDDAEAYAQLADLVDGNGEFDITATDEHLEGIAPGIDKRLLRKLRRGDYAVQGHVDLHGLIADEARGEVERFLVAARADGKRCVLIVHGRGMHSKDGEPVLKRRLETWLSRGGLAKHVLAFATARPSDGGAGALYILLRR